MKKQLKIETGKAILLKDPPETFSEFDSIYFNAGSVVITRKVYDKLMKIGVSLNSGHIDIIGVEGEVVEIPNGTVITANSSYGGCFLICNGILIIEDEKGLEGITGIYGGCIFHPQSVDLRAFTGIISSCIVAYDNGAKLHFEDLTIGDDSHIILNANTLYWVHGDVNALDNNALEKMQQKSVRFHCRCLTIYSSLYEKYRDMFRADNVRLIPDGYGVVWDTTLDGGTSLIHGDKLYVLGDMMIPHDQSQHLREFSSLMVKGTVTMPVSAAASFKAVGKADDYDLYEGVFMEENGDMTVSHDMLQSALARGLSYTIRVNGKLIFTEDVTVRDIDAISAVECNGMLIVPGALRGAIDSKIKDMNGVIGSAEELDKKTEEEANITKINTGYFKF